MNGLKSFFGGTLNGNKTIISLVLMNLFGMEFMKDLLNPEIANVLYEAFKGLAFGSCGHHLAKGFLKKDHS